MFFALVPNVQDVQNGKEKMIGIRNVMARPRSTNEEWLNCKSTQMTTLFSEIFRV